VNTENDRLPLHQRGLQIGFLLAATALRGGLWALPFPRSFYEDFPLPGKDPTRPWAPTTSISCGTTAP
jgi:hypothetical protein